MAEAPRTRGLGELLVGVGGEGQAILRTTCRPNLARRLPARACEYPSHPFLKYQSRTTYFHDLFVTLTRNKAFFPFFHSSFILGKQNFVNNLQPVQINSCTCSNVSSCDSGEEVNKKRQGKTSTLPPSAVTTIWARHPCVGLGEKHLESQSSVHLECGNAQEGRSTP